MVAESAVKIAFQQNLVGRQVMSKEGEFFLIVCKEQSLPKSGLKAVLYQSPSQGRLTIKAMETASDSALEICLPDAALQVSKGPYTVKGIRKIQMQGGMKKVT